MKYKRIKLIESVQYDGDVTDLRDIKAIIESLCKHEYDVSMRVAGEMIMHSKVRITEAGPDGFKYLVLGVSSNLGKSARYADVESLSVTGADAHDMHLKPGVTRWLTMGSTEEFDKPAEIKAIEKPIENEKKENK